jgi:hypothetical protein
MHGVGEVVTTSLHEAKYSTTSHATCRGTRTRDVGGVVNDERRDEPSDEPRDMPRHLHMWRSRSSRRLAARRRVMSRATCQGTRTRGVVEVVDDDPRDVPRHPYARRRRSSRRRAVRRAA